MTFHAFILYVLCSKIRYLPDVLLCLFALHLVSMMRKTTGNKFSLSFLSLSLLQLMMAGTHRKVLLLRRRIMLKVMMMMRKRMMVRMLMIIASLKRPALRERPPARTHCLPERDLASHRRRQKRLAPMVQVKAAKIRVQWIALQVCTRSPLTRERRGVSGACKRSCPMSAAWRLVRRSTPLSCKKT